MGFKDIFFGTKPKIETQTIEDPAKRSVASPLSKFLSEGVGTGVPRFDPKTDTGGRITGEFPEGSLNKASEFLSLDAGDFFTENVEAPAISRFREELAISKEDFAGRLSGSGRFRTEEESINRFATDLASSRAQFELALPEAQFNIARQIKESNDKEAAAQYADWYKSLPINNPILERSLQFLSNSTNTGTTVLSALNPGTTGIMADLMGMIAAIFGGKTPSSADKGDTGDVESSSESGD